MQTANGKIELIIDTASLPTKGKPLSKSNLDFVTKLKAEGIKLQVSDFVPSKKIKNKSAPIILFPKVIGKNQCFCS